MSAARKILLLGSLYLAQGLPYGFFTQALPVLLREMEVPLEDIGLASLLALPWALKFAWAPVVDRTFSPRRWILGLQAAATALAAVLALAQPAPGSVTVLLVAVLLTNLVAATQDIATDGLAVATLTAGERGLGNGVQVAGYQHDRRPGHELVAPNARTSCVLSPGWPQNWSHRPTISSIRRLKTA